MNTMQVRKSVLNIGRSFKLRVCALHASREMKANAIIVCSPNPCIPPQFFFTSSFALMVRPGCLPCTWHAPCICMLLHCMASSSSSCHSGCPTTDALCIGHEYSRQPGCRGCIWGVCLGTPASVITICRRAPGCCLYLGRHVCQVHSFPHWGPHTSCALPYCCHLVWGA